MKKILITLASVAASSALFGASINVSNQIGVDSSAFTDAANTPIPVDTGFLQLGYFNGLDNTAIASAFGAGDVAALNTAWVPFGSGVSMDGAGFGVAGLVNEEFTVPINAGSSFIGENIYLWGGNASDFLSSDEMIILMDSQTFIQDNPLFAHSLGPNGAADASLSVVVGSIGAPIVITADFNSTSTYQMAAIPEPSTFALLFGGAAFLMAARRRRK